MVLVGGDEKLRPWPALLMDAVTVQVSSLSLFLVVTRVCVCVCVLLTFI